VLLVCRFVVGTDRVAEFTERVRRAIELLTAQPGCLRAVVGRSTEYPHQWVLSVEFESVVAYRRSLSPFEVRTHVVPLLSEALTTEPAAYEILLTGADGATESRESLLHPDGTRPAWRSG
jgi:quinol monooxygenase YgiN